MGYLGGLSKTACLMVAAAGRMAWALCLIGSLQKSSWTCSSLSSPTLLSCQVIQDESSPVFKMIHTIPYLIPSTHTPTSHSANISLAITDPLSGESGVIPGLSHKHEFSLRFLTPHYRFLSVALPLFAVQPKLLLKVAWEAVPQVPL